MLNFGSLDFNDETVRQFKMLGRNNQVISLADKNFNCIESVAQIVFALIQGIFFDNLINNWFPIHLSTWITFGLLIERLTSASRYFFLLDDEVWLISKRRTSWISLVKQWIFADVSQDLFPTIFLLCPSIHIVGC